MSPRPRPRSKISWTRVLIVLAVLAVAWAGVHFGRRAGEDYLHSWIEERASSRAGADLSIGTLEIELLPLGVRALDVELTSKGGATLLAHAEEVEITANWSDLRGSPRRLRSLTVTNPRFVFGRDETGAFNWPSFASGQAGVGLAIDRVAVRGGAVDYADGVIQLDLDMRQVQAQASGDTKTRFAGRLDASEVVVELPTGATYVGAVSARGNWENGWLRVVSGRMSGPDLQATIRSGEFDLREKSWSAAFEAAGRAALLGRLGVGDRELDGTWRFIGELSGREAWRLEGRVSAQNLGWDDITLASLAGDLTADPESLSIDGIDGRFTRGRVRAKVDVAWADPARPVRVEAELKDGSLPALLTQFDLNFPEVAGSWGGRGHYVFRAENPLAGSGAADLALRAQDLDGTMAWRRRVPVDIDRGLASFSTLTTDTESERISAAGTYDLQANQADIQYRVDTQRVASWMKLVGLGQDPESAHWLPSSGQGSIEGSFHVMPGDWWSRLTLDLQDVAIGEFSPATVRGPLSVSAEGVRDLRLEMAQFEAAMVLAGAIETREGELPKLSLGVEASGWAVEEVLAQLELTPTLTGPIEGSATIGGTPEDLRLSSHLTVSPAEIGDIPVDSVGGELAVAEGVLSVVSATVEMPAGHLSLGGSLPLGEGEIDMNFTLTVDDLSAGPIGALLPAESGGTLEGQGTLAGTLESPVFQAEVAATSLALGGQDLGDAGPTRGSVRLAQDQLEIEGALGDLLMLSGGGALTFEAANLEIGVESERLEALLALVAPEAPLGLGGRFRGVVRVAGDLEDGLPAPEIRLDELILRYAGHELTALEPVRSVWRDGGLDVESFFLGDEASASEVFLFGRVALAEGAALDLQGQISLDTKWFEPFLPGWQATEGRFEALASIGGSITAPEINGQGSVRQPRLQAEAFPQTFRDIEAVVLFYPDQIVVDGGEAGFAGGRLRAAGSFDPFDPEGWQYRFQVEARDIQLRYPEGWQVRGDAELVVASEPGGQMVRGQVKVDGALYGNDVPIGLTQLLQTAFSRRIELVEESDEFLAATRLNIVVRGEDALNVKNNVASLRGDFDLTLRGTLARPVIFGDVAVEPGSSLLYAGNTYDVQRASLKFANPYRIEPVIDMVATTRLAEYDVTLDLSGTLDRLSVNFASDPPLADLQVLTLLAGGEAPLATDLGGSAGDSGDLAETFLYQQAASVVAARVNRLFGLDKFRIDPLAGDSGNLSSARVTVGKRLGRDLFATYSYDPSQSSQQILELEWRVSRELTVVATQNGDESYALDLRWDRSF